MPVNPLFLPASAPTPTRGTRLRAWRERHARLLAAALVGLATLLLIRSLAPPPAPTEPVLVAARPVPAGEILTQDDVTVARWPRALIPADALTEAAGATGHRTGIALTAGMPLTGQVVAPARSLPAGHVALPVPLGAEVASWLHPGDRVLLGVGAQRTFNAGVIAVSDPGGSTLGVAGTRQPSVLLDVAAPDLNDIAQAARSNSLSVSLNP